MKHSHFLWSNAIFPWSARHKPLIEVLKQNRLFSTLTSRELRALSHIIYERVYEPGECIFTQEDRGFGMYIIVRGKVDISVHETSQAGGESIVTTLGAGDFFGELALVDSENIRTATARAQQKAHVIGFFKPDLTEILERRPNMGVKILYQLAQILGRNFLRPLRKSQPLAKPPEHRPRFTDSFRRRDGLKLAFMALTCALTVTVFFLNPTLSTPAALSLLSVLLLSPVVNGLERRGLPRTMAILFVFGVVGALVTITSFWAASTIGAQWSGFSQSAPRYFSAVIERLEQTERSIQEHLPFSENLTLAQTLMAWGENTGQWFIKNGPALMGNILTWILIVPFFSFVLLKEGRRLRKSFFELVPNRYFELVFMVTSRVSAALTDYLRAKLVEAFFVGLLVTGGLLLVGSPYATVFGFIAGITNIIPYLGPVLGAAPGIALTWIDPTYADPFWPVLIVYGVANVIDTVFIFPIVVAHLVNLHPVVLLTAVILGQHYYGLIGMLLSIPAAATLKVILEQTHAIIYRSPRSRLS